MAGTDTVSVACVNFSTKWGNKAANLARIKAMSRQAARQGSQVIVFPELALSGYECADMQTGGKKSCAMHGDLAETVPGPSTRDICALARELGVCIVFGMPERDETDPDLLYICSVIAGPQGLIGKYRKLHLAPLPRFTERLCFTPGDSIPVFPTRFGTLGVLICYDFYFYPELARIMTLKGADLLINTSASGTGPGKPCFITQQTGCRATENGVYAASANLVGKERTNSYYGHSVIAGPCPPRPATVFARGGDTEEIVSATLNLNMLRERNRMLDWQQHRQAGLILTEMNRLTKGFIELI